MNVTVKGYLGGVQKYESTVETSAFYSTYFQFNFLGIDEVTFLSFGGDNAGFQTYGSRIFVMDDMDVNFDVQPVPLPAAAWFMLTALGGLFGARWVKRRGPATA